MSGNEEETKRILMDLDVVQKSNFPQIVQCYGTLVTDVCSVGSLNLNYAIILIPYLTSAESCLGVYGINVDLF